MKNPGKALAIALLLLTSACNAQGSTRQRSTAPRPQVRSDMIRESKGSPKTASPKRTQPPNGISGKVASGGPAGQVRIEVYVMSMCPFAARALQTLIPVVKKFGTKVTLDVEYVVSGQAGRFSSLHGPAEVEADMVQVCARDVAPSRFLDFLLCQGQNPRAVLSTWMACAKKAGIDVATVQACKNGPLGKKLLAKSAAKTKTRKVRGSPTIYVGNRKYAGYRSELDFTRAICQAMPGTKPNICTTVPKPVEVKILLLNDKRCKEKTCLRANVILRSLRRIFPGARSRVLDYSSPEGKKLYAEARLKYLPALLFDASVDKAPAYPRVQAWLSPAGPYRSLQIGARFDPTAEICDNGIDDTGNGKVDCADSTCKQTLACRKLQPKRLDLFVMSHCPFGIRALNSMKEVLANFKGELDFHIHYIGSKRPDGSLSSMHGPKEVEEDKRALCAMKYYPRNYKFMDYISCRNQDIRSRDWRRCARKGIRAARIARCANGSEGTRLLTASFERAAKLGINASPTWLVNNRYMFSGLDAETVRKNLCRHNPNMKNCSNSLSSNATGPAASCK